MCSGRVDLSFVFRAFANGMDGVFIGGCHLNECHYVTDGNHHAFAMVLLARNLMERIGLRPERLRIEGVSAGEGIRFAEIMNEFAATLTGMGPLGGGEGIAGPALKRRLEAVRKLIPYLRLVERERLRVRLKTEEAYREFFASEETNRLLDELLGDKLALSQILLLLEENPLSTREIAESLGMSSSEVAKHMNRSSRQGFVRYDADRRRYALAGVAGMR
jgi:F420-non-reducing hydrogenase iron-sulfur subunit